MSTLALLCLVLAAGGSASAAGDEPGAPDARAPAPAASDIASARVALLGAAGPVALTRPLDGELASALAAKRRAGARALPRLISSRALAQRLRADPATRKHLNAAAAALGRADKAALYMKRGGAVSAARQAIAELDEAHARFIAPAELARAHAALAYALLLAPADEVGARDALRAAVTADPTFTPDADRQNPTVKRLLVDARAKRRVAPPDSATLDKLAARAQLERVVWLRVTPLAVTATESAAAASVALQVLVYQVSARAVRTNLRKRVPRAKLVSAAADLVEQALVGDKALAGAAGGKPDGVASGGGSGGAAKASRPWYKRWWVWAIAGAVVAGAGVGLGVGLTRGDSNTTPPPNPGGFDIEFRH